MCISDWSSDVCSADLRHIDPYLVSAGAASSSAALLVVFLAAGLGAAFFPAGLSAAGSLSAGFRSAERRVGKVCVSTCSVRRAQDQYKKKNENRTRSLQYWLVCEYDSCYS